MDAKNLLNFTCHNMKLYNCNHANVRPGLIRNLEKAISTITDITQNQGLNSTINVKNFDDETYFTEKFPLPKCNNWSAIIAKTILIFKIKIQFLFTIVLKLLSCFSRQFRHHTTWPQYQGTISVFQGWFHYCWSRAHASWH